MNQLVRISKILNVEPFKITALWNNGEIRINDFTKTFEKWKESENAHLLGLTPWEVFKGVTVTHEPPRTLEWTNYPITFNLKGKTWFILRINLGKQILSENLLPCKFILFQVKSYGLKYYSLSLAY